MILKNYINSIHNFVCVIVLFSFQFIIIHKAAAQITNPQTTASLTYTNPIIHEDFSDPDVIRVGNWFYMTASSFISTPGLPILRSSDLVHWELIGYALNNLFPKDYYKTVHHGAGVWAPSIRFHNGEFYIYYPDPDFGIYMIKSKNITGKWSEPVLVLSGKGLIDPCPLWDDNGKAYLVHAYAGSRAGIKSVLAMKQMNGEGTKIIDEGKLIYDGHGIDPTVEGPKIYKQNGWYYIFAPAGGVSTGWQIVLRSKNIYGPYERKKVMEQGDSPTNGPHQGAWVQTTTGTHWFIHFQDKEAYGRITHLQPMTWKNNWPIIGMDQKGNDIGEPVINYKMSLKILANVNSSLNADPFLPFQWNANPEANWRMPYLNSFRFYAVQKNDSLNNLWNFPALYLQKLPAEVFTFTTKINFNALQIGERTGFVLFGKSYAAIELTNTAKGLQLNYVECNKADKGEKEIITNLQDNMPSSIYIRMQMERDAIASFAYSINGVDFILVNKKFKATPGIWVGAKMGFYCASSHTTNDAGFLEIKSLNIQK